MNTPPPLWKNYQQTLIPACLLWMAGLLLASTCLHQPLFWGLWCGLALVSGLGVLGFSSQYRQMVRWYVWLLCFCLGGVFGALQPTEAPPSDIARRGEISQTQIQGEITREGTSSSKWVLRITQADGQPATGQVMLTIPEKAQPTPPLQIGDTLRLTGKLHQPFPPVYPGQFDYAAYLRVQNITALFKATQVSVESTQPHSWTLATLRWAAHIRDRVTRHFEEHLPLIDAQILGSIVLGEHAVGVDPDVKNAFRQAGLIHLLAASGLNVGLIGAFFLGAGSLLRLPLRVSLLIAILGVGAYCLLTGLPPSVQRAGTMLEVALLLKLFRRELTPVTLLCLAGVLLTCLDPHVLAMLGFQLSFLSTFGLIVMVKPLQEKLGYYIGDDIAGLILVPLVAQLWVTPLLLYHFSQVQLLAIPANILAVPWVIVLSYMGFILGGVSLFLPQVSGWLLHTLGFVVTGLRWLAEWIGNLPLAVYPVASPPLPLIILMLLALFLATYALYHPRLPHWKTIAALSAAMLLAFLLPLNVNRWQQQHHWEITWLPIDYGQSGVEITRTPQGHTLIATPQLNYWASRDLLGYLQHQGIHRIHLLVLADPQIKSLAGLREVLQKTPADRILSASLPTPRLNRELLALAEETGSEISPLSGNDKLTGPASGTLISMTGRGDTLIRWNWANQCMVSHWGQGPLKSAGLSPFTQGCLWVQDKTRGHLRTLNVGNQQATHVASRFSRVVVTPQHAQLLY